MQSVSTTAATPVFTNITVLPSYGYNSCAVSWVMNPAYISDNYGINLYSSRDGLTDWHLVNKNPIASSTTSIGDARKEIYENNSENCKYWNQTINWHYKLELIKIEYAGRTPLYTSVCFSPSVGIYHTLTQAEFSTLRSMIENEILQKDSVDVYILRPKGLNGNKHIKETVVTPTIDYLTGEQSGVSTDTLAYGQAFLGGYSTPIKTQLTFDQVVIKQTDDQQGHGTTVNKVVNITGYSFPRLIRGDMIVVPQTDERYFFNEYSQEYLFKGLYPFKFQGQMQLIPRNQVEYKIKLRDLEECCALNKCNN